MSKDDQLYSKVCQGFPCKCVDGKCICGEVKLISVEKSY